MNDIKYLSSTEYAKLHGVHPVTIRKLLAGRHIPGVIRTGRSLLIPDDAPLPRYDDTRQYDYEENIFLAMGDYASQNHTSKRRMQELYEAGELTGAIEAGGRIYIKSDYEMPTDGRIKSGQYIGWRDKYSRSRR